MLSYTSSQRYVYVWIPPCNELSISEPPPNPMRFIFYQNSCCQNPLHGQTFRILRVNWDLQYSLWQVYYVQLLCIMWTLLEVPKTKLVRCGDRAFYKTAPVLWNDLTHELKLTDKHDTFKSRLKTKLFKEYYE